MFKVWIMASLSVKPLWQEMHVLLIKIFYSCVEFVQEIGIDLYLLMFK